MGFAFPLVVTVSSASVLADEYGNPGPNPHPSAWTSATARCDVQPVRTDETIDGVSNVDVDEVRFFLEPGTVVASGDRLEVAGVTYEAIGPADARDYGSRLDYVRIRARRSA